MFEGEGTPSEDDGKTCTCKQRISVLMRANAQLEKEIKELKTILCRVKALLNELPVNSSPISSLHSLKSPSSSPTMETFNPCIVSTQIDDASAHPRSPILGAQKRRPAKPVVDLDETYFEPAEKAKASAGKRCYEVQTPKKYPHVGPTVRGKKRKLLRGFTCADCASFYRAAGLGEKEVQTCSRHRGLHSPAKTPPGYWDVRLPSTQVMLQKQLAPLSEEEL